MPEVAVPESRSPMRKTFVSAVKLLEVPKANSPFYVVEGEHGKHYVSGLGGRAAKGLPLGVTLSLYKTESDQIRTYMLERM